MTKKKLLERIEKLEDVVGRDYGDDGDGSLGLGWKIHAEAAFSRSLRDNFNLLLSHLKLRIKETPEQPAKKEIVPEEKPIIIGGSITSCCIAADKLSTPPHPKKPKNPKKRTLRK